MEIISIVQALFFDSFNGSPNNAVIGMGGASTFGYPELNLSESIVNYLGSPIINNQAYTLNFWAYQFTGSKCDPDVSNSTGYPAQAFNGSSVSAVLSFATHSVFLPSSAPNYPDPGLTALLSLTLANVFNVWKHYTITFTTTAINSGNWLYIGMDKNLTYNQIVNTLDGNGFGDYFFYTLSDDVSIKPGTVITPTITTSRSTTLCKGEYFKLSAQAGANSYVWMPLNAYTQAVSVSPAVTTIYTVSTTSYSNAFPCIAQSTVQIVVNPCTEMESYLTNANSFKIYPNPSDGEFYIENEQRKDLKILIYNESGQIVTFLSLDGSNNRKIILNDLPPGFYFIESQGIHAKLIISK